MAHTVTEHQDTMMMPVTANQAGKQPKKIPTTASITAQPTESKSKPWLGGCRPEAVTDLGRFWGTEKGQF